MAGEFRSLPLDSGPIDPTRLINENFSFLQQQLQTTDNLYHTIFSETLSNPGILMYELRIIGKGAVDFLSIKRTFTVLKTESTTELLDISSDYTKRTDATWNVTAFVDNNDIIIQVKGALVVNWAAQIVKTIHNV